MSETRDRLQIAADDARLSWCRDALAGVLARGGPVAFYGARNLLDLAARAVPDDDPPPPEDEDGPGEWVPPLF